MVKIKPSVRANDIGKVDTLPVDITSVRTIPPGCLLPSQLVAYAQFLTRDFSKRFVFVPQWFHDWHNEVREQVYADPSVESVPEYTPPPRTAPPESDKKGPTPEWCISCGQFLDNANTIAAQEEHRQDILERRSHLGFQERSTKYWKRLSERLVSKGGAEAREVYIEYKNRHISKVEKIVIN